jgi:hypothetical protein
MTETDILLLAAGLFIDEFFYSTSLPDWDKKSMDGEILTQHLERVTFFF